MANPASARRGDDDVFAMFDYLAWCRRSALFEGDFKVKVRRWYQANSHETENYAQATANALWRLVLSRGIIETFQEYIGDKEACRALVHAINS